MARQQSYEAVESASDGSMASEEGDLERNFDGETKVSTPLNRKKIVRRRRPPLTHPLEYYPTQRKSRCFSTLYSTCSVCVLTLMAVASLLVIGSFFIDETTMKKISDLKQDNSTSMLGKVSISMFPPSNVTDENPTKNEAEAQPDAQKTENKLKVHYDPSGLLQSVNPFDFEIPKDDIISSVLIPNVLMKRVQEENLFSHNYLGYFKNPHIVNNYVVFCSEGDAFLARVPKESHGKAFSASKLTNTVGNVMDPKLHPSLRYLAYTATYTARRDIYLMDLLAPRSPALRLTFWDNNFGVSGLVGWSEDSLIFRAASIDASLPDERLYTLYLNNLTRNVKKKERRHLEEPADVNGETETSSQTDSDVSVLQIDPVPLSQAIDAARHDGCWYFVRFRQSSRTIRYVGGTAESLWRYCDGDGEATHLTDDFTGTSKSPQIYDDQYLFFLSDRAGNVNKWEVDRMNIWAMSLDDKNSLIQITDTACDFEGRTIQEYSIDAQTGNLVVRIGADLYMMEKSAIAAKLTAGNRQLGEDADDFRLLAESNSTNNGKDEGFPGNSTNITTAASIHEVVDDPVESMTHIEANDAETDVDLSVAEQAALNETVLGDGNATNATEAPKVYYKYDSIDLESRKQETFQDHHSGNSESLKKLPILVHSDFSSKQERLLPVNMNRHKTSMDIYTTVVGTTHVLMTLRGQLWVAPVVNKEGPDFTGGGMNLPPRRYRVAPGAMMGGVVRILKSMHVPNPVEDNISDRRLAVILATDPLTDTSEHAFYLVETQSGVTPMFIDLDHLPKPFVGGHLQGGSTSDGGLGSVKPDTLTISPCGRRMAWSDTDGRIVAMNLPQYQTIADRESATFIVLPDENEMGEPMVGDEVALDFSPGGRYLTVEHNARNQFTTISIVDLGDPAGKDKVADIEVTRVVQATPSRFNSFGAYWGKTPKAVQVFEEESNNAESAGTPEPKDVSTTLYFLSDRDISTDVDSPWGTRAPMPHFKSSNVAVYALPLKNVDSNGPLIDFMEGGAKELSVATELEKKRAAKRRLQERSSPLKGVYTLADNSFNGGRHLKEKTASRRIAQTNITDSIKMSDSEGTTLRNATFPLDLNIDFGPTDLTFARHAYRLPGIKEGGYIDIVCLTPEASTFVLIEDIGEESVLTVATKNKFQSDRFDITRVIPSGHQLAHYGLSTSRDTVYLGFAPDGIHVVIPNSEGGVKGFVDDSTLKSNIVDSDGLFLSVWPSLEYRQLYDDAWRMLRDYFYDPEMTGIDWPDMHKRYLPLVARCTKREELDDVLAQMASELSALHVFVYGGEYESPLHLDRSRQNANIVASLGAVLRRTPEWKGYEIMSIPERDPDFNVIDGSDTIYSPLSDKSLQLSGQRGLEVGDVIVGVNGESVMRVPDIHMLFRGMAGRSVRLDVLRLASDKNSTALTGEVEAKPLITVPLHPLKAGDLRYHAWEYKTRQMAEKLAGESGFSVGYVHLRDMSGPEAENAFARGFFPNYDKEAFILDVRHNRGGNIDSWVLDVLQRRPWMYWQSRDFNTRNGGLGWDEQFAFRGHIVVLIDEKTSSDGEGVSRGISELGLGRLIGTRTWGGGIWLSSDNHLVDGGIATAPEIGTYNDNFGWGLGIEQMGVKPDIVVDNDPHQSFAGKDAQLERAIAELKDWIAAEPIVKPEPPDKKRDMTMGNRECSAIEN